MTFEDKYLIFKLEDAVKCSGDDLEKFRNAIFGAMFSRDRVVREGHIEYLKFNFNGTLRRGYYREGHILLDVNNNGDVVNVDVGAVPRAYMDVGHHGFEI